MSWHTLAAAIHTLLLFFAEVALLVTTGTVICWRLFGLETRRLPEIAFVAGYAAASLSGLFSLWIFGSAGSVPLVVAGVLPLVYFFGRGARKEPEFLASVTEFRRTRAGKIAFAAAACACLAVGLYRLPAVAQDKGALGVTIGTNIYPDEMRTLGLPLSLAARGFPMRFPTAVETVDLYPAGAFALSAGAIAWRPGWARQILIADSMAQTAFYCIVAMLAAVLFARKPRIALLVLVSSLVSVSFDLWPWFVQKDQPWFTLLFGYYKTGSMRTTVAWYPAQAFLWVMNHVVSFSAALISIMWIARQKESASHVSVWGPASLFAAFAFSCSLDVPLVVGCVVALILGISAVVQRGSAWLKPGFACLGAACAVFFFLNLQVLLGRGDTPGFEVASAAVSMWFNIGLLLCTLGGYFVVLAVGFIASGGRARVEWPWWLAIAVGLAFALAFAHDSIWLWRFTAMAHLLLSVMCGRMLAAMTGRAPFAVAAVWLVFLVAGAAQSAHSLFHGMNGASRRSLAVAEAIRWIQDMTPLSARVAELREAEGSLVADVNFLRTGNSAGADVTKAYHVQIGYSSYLQRFSVLANGIAATDYVLAHITSGDFSRIFSDCGAEEAYRNPGAAVYRITEACRASIVRDPLLARLQTAIAAAHLVDNPGDQDVAGWSDDNLVKHVLRHPESIALLRNRIEQAYWPKGAFQAAAMLVEPVLRQYPDLPEAHYSLAFSLAGAGTDSQRALFHFGRAMELGYSEFWVRYNRGSAYLRYGQFEKAVADLKRARALDPSEKSVGVLLAQAESLAARR